MEFTLAFQNENRPPPVFESMFMIHFRHKVAKNDISKSTLFCLQYVDKTILGLSISMSKLCFSGHPHLPLHRYITCICRCMYYMVISFEMLWDAVVFWLMVLVAEEHNCCLKELWDWLEGTILL